MAQVIVAQPRPSNPVALKFFAAGQSNGIKWVTAQLQVSGDAPFVGRTIRHPAQDQLGQGRWIVYFNLPASFLGGQGSATGDLVVFDETNAERRRVPNIVVNPGAAPAPVHHSEARRAGLVIQPFLGITPSPQGHDCLTAYTPSGTLDDGESSITQAWVEKPKGTFVRYADALWPDPNTRTWVAQFPDLSSSGGGNYWLFVVSDVGTTASYGPVDLETAYCDVGAGAVNAGAACTR